MSLFDNLDHLHAEAKANRWLRYFTIFVRLSLAFGFFTAGMVKIMGERFAAGLSEHHPMGHYLAALHVTGFYYTFIGLAQVVAAGPATNSSHNYPGRLYFISQSSSTSVSSPWPFASKDR